MGAAFPFEAGSSATASTTLRVLKSSSDISTKDIATTSTWTISSKRLTGKTHSSGMPLAKTTMTTVELWTFSKHQRQIISIYVALRIQNYLSSSLFTAILSPTVLEKANAEGW